MVVTISALFEDGKERASARATAPLSPDTHIMTCSTLLILRERLGFTQEASGKIAIARDSRSPTKALRIIGSLRANKGNVEVMMDEREGKTEIGEAECFR